MRKVKSSKRLLRASFPRTKTRVTGGKPLRLEYLESRQMLNGDPLINELSASNGSTLTDLEGDLPDWFEIRNVTAAPVSLLNHYVTDNPLFLTQWQFTDDITIAPGDFLVAFASGKDRHGENFRVRLTRDLIATPDATFLVDLPNDMYDVEVTMGDDRVRDNVDVYVQGVLTDTVTTQPDEYVTNTYAATVNGGQLSLRFDDTGGSTGRAAINAVVIRPTAGGDAVARFDMGPPESQDEPGGPLKGPVEPGYTPISSADTYSAAVGYGWIAGATISQPDRGFIEGEQHTNFELNANGDYLALVQPDGMTIVSEFGPAGDDFPQQFVDVSYGLVDEVVGTDSYFLVPTPGLPNDSNSIPDGIVGDTTFTFDRGFYDTPFDTTVTTTTPGATLIYTTDGSEPTLTNGTVVAPPDMNTPPSVTINIDKTTVLQAVAFKDNYVPGIADSQSYLFVEDIILQDPQQMLDAGYPSTWNGLAVDYGVDPDVIGQGGTDLFGGVYANSIRDDLMSIPTVSLGIDVDDMFSAATGIYANPSERGVGWERRISMEFFDPNNADDEFQVNAGVRIIGGRSRFDPFKKKALRFLFKSVYGPSELEYPLYGEGADNVFNSLVLRHEFNDSWTDDTSLDDAAYVRDRFSSNTHLAMGAPDSHGRYVHVYINGFYWGMYDIIERPEEQFFENYFGGDRDEYDVIKHRGTDPDVVDFEVVHGTRDTWDTLTLLALDAGTLPTDEEKTAALLLLQGNNPDGTNNPAFEDYLDLNNYIDYIIINHFTANRDWPGGNWYAGRLRGPDSDGFKFIAWDAECTMGFCGSTVNTDNILSASGVATPHGFMLQNKEYKLNFADRIQRNLTHGGVLTPAQTVPRIEAAALEMENGIVGESARWGDAFSAVPRTRDIEWAAAVDSLTDTFMVDRLPFLLERYRFHGFLPDIDAPELLINDANQYGGTIVPGDGLKFDDLAQPGVTIYYTLTGVDPREIGGAISGSALTYQPGVDPAITLNENTLVKARVLDGSGEWSALAEALFSVAPPDLRVTELNYNPYDPTPSEVAAGYTNNDDFEFVVLQNVGPSTTNLVGTRFTDGIDFTFPSLILNAGERVIVAKNQGAFETRYGTGPKFAGVFDSGGLSNGGEGLTLVAGDDAKTTILDFAYDDNDPWPESPDGDGATLVLIDPFATPAEESGKYYRWRGSTEFGGTPGVADTNPHDVVINEVVINTDVPPPTDSIELYNPTGAAINIGGMFLSDSANDFLKFEIPLGTMLGPGAYLVFDEDDFNPDPLTPPEPHHFALSGSSGDDIYLTVPDGSGGIDTFVDDVHFGAAPDGESFGRTPNGSGRLASMTSITLGADNSDPRVGPVVFSEIYYHSSDPSAAALAIDPNLVAEDLEFIEVLNPTGSAEDLTDWRIRGGADFDFDPGTMIGPGETLVIISFDPDAPANVNLLAAFREHHGIDNSVTLLGGYGGLLNNDGDIIELQRPDAPIGEPLIIPRLQEDQVIYDDLSPWPLDADGLGKSLTRTSGTAYGNLAASWTAQDPTPGSAASNMPGDMDLDGDVDFDDIDDFVVGLSDAAAYEVMFGVPATFNGDIDGDGDLDFDDIDDFVIILSGGGGLQAGDMSADGHVNDSDATQMAIGLFDPANYEATFSAGSTAQLDTDQDGDLDFDDIDGFVTLLKARPNPAGSASSIDPFRTVRWTSSNVEHESVWSQQIDWLI